MADQRISQLNELGQGSLEAGDLLPIVDSSSSETKKITAKSLFQGAANLADSSSIDLIKLNQASTTKLGVGALSLTGTDKIIGRFSAGAGAAEEIILTAVGRQLLDDATAADQRTTLGLGTLATQNGTFSGTHSGTSSGTNTGDQTIALTGDVTGTGTGSFATTIADSAVTTAKLPDGAITTAKLAASAVTAAKIANSATTVIAAVSPNVDGVFTGQQWFDTVAKLQYMWDGSAWTQSAGFLNSLAFSDSTPLTFSAATDGVGVATITTTLDTQSAATVFAGPTTGSAAAPTFRALVATDLPVAGASTNGAVQPGTGLTVTGAGVLNHTNSATAGTYTKVTIDAQGHVSTGTTLSAADIPVLDTSKITTGIFAANLIGTNTITGEKLADQSTVQFGGAGSTANVVTFPVANFKGQLFWDELNNDMYIWSGSAWLSVTVTSGELILAGTFDASSGTAGAIAALTAAGTAAGFALGALPAPTESNKQFYFVVSLGGTPSSGQVSGIALDPPDNILSTGAAWQKIDVSATVAGNSAVNITFTPTGDIVATNVQTAIQELDTEKIPKALTSANILVGNSSNVATSTAVTGDVTISNAGVTAIAAGVILNADINASAAIVDTKLATIATAGKVSNSATTATNANTASTIVARDASGNFTAGTITANLTGTASLATSAAACTGNAATVTTNANLTGDVTSVGNATSIAAGVIVNADINASAAIVDTKLAQITTAGKVSGTAITTGNISTSGSITTTSTLSVQGLTVGKGAGAISTNTVLGNTALGVNTTGFENTAIGKDALFTNTTGSSNTACGINTLFFNVSGIENTAIGGYALQNNTTGNLNTACGQGNLYSNTTGVSNTAYGAFAIYSNTTGVYNTATGTEALKNNTTGITNTANGLTALFANTTGDYNTAIGASSLYSNTIGTSNVAVGVDALYSNTTGVSNTATGLFALRSNTTGSDNTAIGLYAGRGDNSQANTTGSNNTFIGANAMGASATASNVITLGNGSIATLRCQVTTITALSDARDKINISNIPAGLSFINALRPVSFEWNTRDGAKVGASEFGFIAQELLEVQASTGITVPNLVSAENPDRLEASAGTLLPVLVNAVQELTAMVKNLQAELSILKGA
jgi:trimeric autotransporter adhesin